MSIGVAGCSDTAAAGLAEQLLASALDFAELLIEQVLEPAQASSQSPGCAKEIDCTKEIAEIAMLLRLVDRTAVHLPRVAALAERIAPLARGRRVRERAVSRPSQAAPQLLAHGCLHQIGCTDNAFHELALATVSASAARAEERVPYRLLDSGWIRHLLLGDTELDHPALPVSPLGRGVDLIAAGIEEAYAFGHALPYATDFGRVALADWVDVRWLSEIADALILKALDEDDLDLLGELLMAPALLRLEWSTIQWFGWQLLIDTWRRYGFVPGPGLPPAAPDETAAQTTERVLGTVYHTTLVGGLLVATVASYGYWPLATPPPAATAPVEVVGDRLAWQRFWHRLAPADRCQLAAVPASLALHRAVSDCDVRAISDCLRGAQLHLLPGPLVTQTTEFLNRLVLLIG